MGTPLIGASTGSGPASVTLITGDRVEVYAGADGQQLAAVVSVNRDPGGYLIRRVQDDLFVVPASAAPMIQAGRLDERLFNVTSLIEQGYDDETSDRIPLIVQFADAPSAQGAATPAAAEQVEVLESIGGAALSVPRVDADDFWRDLADPDGPSATSVTSVWLDAKVRATLDRSVEQIDVAPAWEAGYDGAGVTVAVLDSGHDPGHPDLAGRVVEEANFTDRPDAIDEIGHGTHVASITGGSGAATPGGRTGVAPGADLLIGRVLGPWGGQESWVIEGMEWAVGRGADVVNMSLGSWEASDCTDPVSQAAQRLARKDTSLFVVAAGNTGHREGITSPACVPEVLAVGAVDREGATAGFSARGPAPVSHVIKPELSAPGVDIMAAALGSPGDNHYQPMSGTSMAAPHVAGAAAIVAQRHPDLSASGIKAALVSAAAPAALDGIYAQGSGVLDVARAVEQTLVGPGAVDLASFTWPHGTTPPETRSLTYRNLGSADVTVNLQLEMVGQDGTPAPRGMVGLGASRLSVPAGGAATVDVTIDPGVRVAAGSYGEFGGRLVATGADGLVVTTPVGFWLEPDTVTLDLSTLDRHGIPANGPGFVDVYNLDTASGQRMYLDGSDQSLRVRSGRYSVVAMIPGYDAGITSMDDSMVRSLTYAGRPELHLTRDTSLVLDARQGRRTVVTADDPVEHRGGLLGYGRWTDLTVSGAVLFDEYVDELYVVPDRGPVKTGDFELGTFLRMYAPSHQMWAGDMELEPEDIEWGTLLDGTGSATLVDAGGGTPEEFAAAGVRGKFALVHVADPWEEPMRILQVLRDAEDAGARGVLVSRGGSGRWSWSVGNLVLTADGDTGAPGFTVTPDEAAALRAEMAMGDVTMRWTAVADSPYVYNLALTDAGQASPDQRHRVRAEELGRVDETWYAPGAASKGYGDYVGMYRPWDSGGFLVAPMQRVRVPQQRVQYFTPGDTGWQTVTSAQPTWGADVYDKVRTYAAGERLDTSWWKHPMQTGVRLDRAGTPQHMGERQGNVMGFDFPHWQDADPDHVGPRAGFGDLGSLDLYADGQHLDRSPFASGQFVVPGDAERFELRVVTDRAYAGGETYPEWRMSLSTATTFRFDSARPAGEDVVALPLLLPDYDAELDVYNTAPSESDFPIRLTFTGQADYDHGRVDSVRLWTSSDDGETWVEARVTPQGDAWIGHVDNRSASGGYVTLKVVATDANGADVEQVVERAYGVR